MKIDLSHIIAAIIGFILFDLIFLPFIRGQRKKGLGKSYMWGIYLTVFGGILTLLGVYLAGLSIANQGWIFPLETMGAIGIFLLVGLPCLVIGIFIINNP
jgi:hypothetical protein